MNDTIISIIRTITPILVGWVAAQLLRVGIEIDSVSLAAFLQALLSSAYYVLARILEERFTGLRWLLGASKTPSYEA